MTEAVARAFLQTVIARGMLTRTQADQEIRRIASLYGAEGVALDVILATCNKKLTPLDLNLSMAVSENDGILYLMLINNRQGDPSKKSLSFMKNTEIHFLKKLVKTFFVIRLHS